MRTALSLTLVATAGVLLVTMPACATNPVTGERELMLMTEADEISLGAEADQEIVATYGLYSDQRVQDYVNRIGQEMARNSHRPHLQWHFRVLDTEIVNAFALPGGYVYVTRGTLGHLNSEAELAMVIGHEIGHVTARHGAKAWSRQMLVLGGLVIGSLASEKFRDWAPWLAVGAQLLFLKYSRDQERQSDDLGVEYAYRVGYDPQDFDDFFITLNKMKEESGGGLSLPSFLSTHPVTANRITDVRAKGEAVIKTTPPAGKLAVRRDEYLQMVDGIVFGPNPRNGFVQQGLFLHPDLRFQFAVPNNWNIDNSARMVQMAPESGDAVLQLTLSPANTPRAAFDQFVSENDIEVLASESARVGGFDAFYGIGRVVGEETSYSVSIGTVRKQDSTYNFIGIAETKNFSTYRGAFERTFTSFAELRDAKALAIQPQRISVSRINGRLTLRDFALRQKFPNERLDELSLINGVDRDEMLAPGRLVKMLK